MAPDALPGDQATWQCHCEPEHKPTALPKLLGHGTALVTVLPVPLCCPLLQDQVF